MCIMLLLTACAGKINNIHTVALDNNINYTLQAIPESLVNVGLLSHFEVKQPGKNNTFLMQVEFTQTKILISGMTAEGLSLFNISWDNQEAVLDYTKSIDIDPKRILAELQLVLWPSDLISQGLAKAKLIATPDSKRVMIDGSLVYDITEQDKINKLINLKQKYSITITTLERWRLSDDNNAKNHQTKP